MKNLQAVILLIAGALLFGCICGGGGGGWGSPTPIPEHTATPFSTATPAGGASQTPTATPAGTATPSGGLATPTPSGEEQSWEDVFGCAKVGLSYTYRMTAGQGSIEMSYETRDGGSVEGVDTVLKTITTETQGTTVTMREWDSKVGCRCVKTEIVYGGQTFPGQCPPPGSGGGEPEDAHTTITNVGVETVSVPAYTGPAMKIRVTSTGSSGTVTVDVWQAPNIPIPVKWSSGGTTAELVRYSA